jgi:hypothetical protein
MRVVAGRDLKAEDTLGTVNERVLMEVAFKNVKNI